MQLLMVLLSALIALVLAPGLIWLLAAGAVAYGVVIALGAILSSALMFSCVMVPVIKRWRSRRNTHANIREANRVFREKEKARLAEHSPTTTWTDDEDCDTEHKRKSCSQCQMEMPENARRCPSCWHEVSPQVP